MWSKRDGRKIRKTFTGKGALAAAKSWRVDVSKAVADHRVSARPSPLFRDAVEQWFADVDAGIIRTRGGGTFKPSVVRSYRASLMKKRPMGYTQTPRSIMDELGGRKLGEITRSELRVIAEDLVRLGLDGSTIRNAFMPVRAIFSRAIDQELVAVLPTDGLRLPAPQGTRDRIADAGEASALLAALREADRPLWAVAFYAGLRRGEIAALKWSSLDLDAGGAIAVEASWDPQAGLVAPKSKAGRRQVPIVAPLRAFLLEHRMRSGRPDGDQFVFSGPSGKPFVFTAARRRALTDWKAANAKAAKELEERLEREPKPEELAEVTLSPIGLHEARHTFASMSIAAGVNLKALSTYMGHSSITITLDRYGHLMPDASAEAVERLDAYLSGARSGAHPPLQVVEPHG